jgi:hypothetical protein
LNHADRAVGIAYRKNNVLRVSSACDFSHSLDPKLTSPPQIVQWVVGSRSGAQEKSDLFEEPIGSRLMLQEQMILALEGDEAGAGNASR